MRIILIRFIDYAPASPFHPVFSRAWRMFKRGNHAKKIKDSGEVKTVSKK